MSKYTDCAKCRERFWPEENMQMEGGVCLPCRTPQLKWVCTECGAKVGALHKTHCHRSIDVLRSECAPKK